MMIYGLSKSPDYEEKIRITEIIYSYISTVRFDNALEYPVYPNSSQLRRLKSIAWSLSTISQRNLKTEDSYRHFLITIKNGTKGVFVS